MKIRPMGFELLHAGRKKKRKTWQRQQSLFTIFRRGLKTGLYI